MSNLIEIERKSNMHSDVGGNYLSIGAINSENIRAQIREAGLKGIAPLEAWTVQGSNRDLAYSTHGVFRFFGKFPPPIANHLISNYTRKGDAVLDPMCGSGTTGVECLLLGRNAVLFDVNPLSLMLARVKTRHIEKSLLESAAQYIKQAYKPLGRSKDAYDPIGLRNPEHWFLPETIQSLRGLKKIIETEMRPDVREALLVAFAGTVRRVSRATTQQGRLFLDAETAINDALPTFLKRMEKLSAALSTLPKRGRSLIRIYKNDSRKPFDRKYHESTNLLILHPPYFNAYRYSSVNSLELSWLDHAHGDVAPQEVREFFKVGKPEKVEFYLQDMAAAIENAAALVRPGGVIALMIGDTVLRGEHICVLKNLLGKIKKETLSVEKIALRVPRYTEATWVASQRRKEGRLGATLCDYVVILRK